MFTRNLVVADVTLALAALFLCRSDTRRGGLWLINIIGKNTIKQRLKPIITAILAVLVALVLSAQAHEAGAHIHGTAKLQVAVDGNILTLDFESPLDNLIGFEHQPRTDKQKATVRAMAERLNKPETLFLPTPAASCMPVSAKLESPVLEPAKKTDGDGHADLDAEFVFKCAQPSELRGMEIKLFDAFPNLHRLDVQVAGARGQAAARLTPAQRHVSW